MDFFEILKITVPALLVLITSYLTINKLLKNEDNRRNTELYKSNQSHITPVRLRAYERLVILLERTNPNYLLLNIQLADMSVIQLQSELLSTIRQEFAHNVAQQIYISDDAWKFIRGAQESLLQLVNACSAKCNPTDTATKLAELILQVYSSTEETPTDVAIHKLKTEISGLY